MDMPADLCGWELSWRYPVSRHGTAWREACMPKFNTATLASILHVSVSKSGNSFTCTTSCSFLRATHICSSHSNSPTTTSHRRTSYGDLLSPIKTQTLLHPPSSARRFAPNTGTVIHLLFPMEGDKVRLFRNDGHSFSHLPRSGCPDGLRFSS